MEVDKKIELALSSLDDYSKTKIYRTKILQGDQSIMNAVQFILAQILRSPSAAPIQKMLAIKNQFSKDCIETFNDDFISQFQATVLPIMEKIALFDRRNPDENRGKNYFSTEPDSHMAMIGNTFFRLVLECLWVWSKWFPIDPDTQVMSLYKLAVQRLIHQGVKFVKLEYFIIENVMKNLPEQQVPIKLLQEAYRALKEDFMKTSGEGSNLKVLQGRLYVDLRKGLVHDSGVPVFPQDRIKKALKRADRNKRRESARIRVDQMNFAVKDQVISQNQSRLEKSMVSPNIQMTKSPHNESLQASNYMPNHLDQTNQNLNHHAQTTIRQLQKEIVDLVKENKSLRGSIQQRDNELITLRQKLDNQTTLNQRLEADNRTLQQHLTYNTQFSASQQPARFERSRFEFSKSQNPRSQQQR